MHLREYDRADSHLMSSCTTVAPDAKEGSSGSYSAVVRKVGWSVGGHLLPLSLTPLMLSRLRAFVVDRSD